LSLTRIRSLATKADIEAHFATHGTGEITEVKLMNGFGFIEYKDSMDARDVVPGKSLSLPIFNRFYADFASLQLSVRLLLKSCFFYFY